MHRRRASVPEAGLAGFFAFLLTAFFGCGGVASIRSNAPHDLVGRTPSQQVLKAVRSHPFGASQVAFPGAPSSLRLIIRIDLQDDLGDFSPIGAVALGSNRRRYVMWCCSSYPVRTGAVGAESAPADRSAAFPYCTRDSRNLRYSASTEESGQESDCPHCCAPACRSVLSLLT